MEKDEAHFTNEDRKILTEVKVKLDRAIDDIAKLSSSFATREELAVTQKEVDDIKTNLNKAVWIVLTVVFGAVLSLVIINYR